MGIAEDKQRIETAVSDIKTEIINKGVDVPEGTRIDGLPSLISNITSGGGDEETLKGLIDRSITKITVPYGTTVVGMYAFSQCQLLEEVNLPDTVDTLKYDAFYFCKSLKKISLPSGLKKIEAQAFYSCLSLTTVDFNGAQLTEIPNQCFMNCSNLELTELPKSITSIVSAGFTGCSKLALTKLPSALTEITAMAFQGCSALALTELPSGVVKIGNSGFWGCTNLDLKSFPEGLTEIGSYAFRACVKFKDIIIPEAVTKIDSSAFHDCKGLTSVTFKGTPTTLKDPFTYCDNLTTINVPWAEGEVAGAPWGAVSATINYNYTEETEA